MNLTAFLTAVRLRLNVPSDDPAYPDATVTASVNQALEEIASMRDWPWLHATWTTSTTAGTASYQLPAAFVRARSVKIDGVPYQFVDEDQLDEYDYHGHLDGVYHVAAIQYATLGDGTTAGNLLVRPTPATTGSNNLIVRYVAAETTLSSGTDTPKLPVRWHNTAADLAASWCFRRVGNTTEADRWKTLFAARVPDLMREVDRSTPPKRVRIRPGMPL